MNSLYVALAATGVFYLCRYGPQQQICPISLGEHHPQPSILLC